MHSSKPGLKKGRPLRKKTGAAATEHLSREQVLLALEKKKRCNARAMLIVQEFIDPVADQEHFLDKLQYINQCHFDDIVEERFITLLCGYPMCTEKLAEIPKQQFFISRASNQVYDITERKKFCSSGCFRASNFVRVQLLTSPLWMRDQEPVPEFKLMDEWTLPSTISPPESMEIDDRMQRLHIHTNLDDCEIMTEN